MTNRVAGPGLMIVAMMIYAAHDAIAKHVSVSASIPQMLAIESLVSLALLAPWIARRGVVAIFNPPSRGLHALRAALLTADITMLFWSLSGAPLADVLTIYQAAPTLTMVLAVLLLRDPADRFVWIAAAMGVVGVVLVVQPGGAALSMFHLLAVAGMFAYAGVNLLARSLRDGGVVTIVAWQSVALMLASAPLLPFFWRPLSPAIVGLALAMGVLTAVGSLMVARALALAPAPRVMPLHYTIIVWAVLLGWLVWGDVPGPMAIGGAVLVICGGLLASARPSRGREP